MNPHPDDRPWKALMTRSLFLQAWDALERDEGPPEEWTDPRSRLRAGSLLDRLGAAKRSRKLILKTWRLNRDNALVREGMFWEVLEARGPRAAWDWIRVLPIPESERSSEQATHLGKRAYALICLRDFQRAERLIGEAMELDREDGWLPVLRSELNARRDRYEDSLADAELALKIEPYYWGSTLSLSEALIRLGRDAEALKVLRESNQAMESATIARALANLEIELGEFAAADESLGTFERYMPFMETGDRSWLMAQRCDLACHRDDHAAAAEFASQVEGSTLYKRIAERLAKPKPGARKRALDVGFVRQHHLTCVPATLSALSRYWRKPVDHIEVADAICHDGTANHSERNWATNNGWIAREFKITEESAKMLIDRGVPFSLSTVSPGNAHAQAVIGYDEYRAAFLIRDPYYRSKTEFLIEEGLEQQAPNGPRGFVILPPEEKQRLEGVELPEEELHDILHAARSALDKHDREAAGKQWEELQSRAPGHRVTLTAEEMLAAYDGDPFGCIQALEKQLAIHPGEVNCRLRSLGWRRNTISRDERLGLLREAAKAKETHALLWFELAEELAVEARTAEEAKLWLRKAGRVMFRAQAFHCEAGLLWEAGDRDAALELYRLAACLEDKDEDFAETYFRAARWLNRTDEALALMRERYVRDGLRSSSPSRTLYRAYEMLDQIEDGLAVLRESLQRRPDDAEQALFVARTLAYWRHTEEAEALLKSAETKSRRSLWCRAAAALANQRGDSEEELALWREVNSLEPLAMDACRSVAHLLEQREGREATIKFLDTASAQYPHFWPMRQLYVQWLSDEGADLRASQARKLAQDFPHQPWARRELGLVLSNQKQRDEAIEELLQADLLAPSDPFNAYVHGLVLEGDSRISEAREKFRQALLRSIDTEAAIHAMLRCSLTPEERAETFDFLKKEFARQTTNGDGLLTFVDAARPYLDPDALFQFYKEAHAARPDLWQTWIVLAKQLAVVGRKEEALAKAKSATEKFPLLPRIWVELGEIHRFLGQREERINALKKVPELNPGYSYGMRELSTAYEEAARYQEGMAALELAHRHNPKDFLIHGFLAEALDRDGKREQALTHIREAIELDPGYQWAWGKLREWGEPEAALNTAKAISEARPGEPRSWMLLADCLTERSQFSERLEALDRAIAANPSSHAALSEKARVLAVAGRFEEAEALCRPPVGERMNPAIHSRLAWIKHFRGQPKEAIEAMSQSLQAEPNNRWGWECLVEWRQEQRDFEGCEDALKHLIQLTPLDPYPWGFLGDLRSARDDRPGAKEAFQRSISIDPKYAFGGLRLFHLQLEDKDWAAARTTLDTIRPHHSTLVMAARECALAVASKDEAKALEAFGQMLGCPEDMSVQWDYLLGKMDHSKQSFREKAEDLAAQSLNAPSQNPEAGKVYARLRRMRGKPADLDVIDRLAKGSEAWKRAIRQCIEDIGDHYYESHWRERYRLWRLRRRHAQALRENTALWGSVSYSLLKMNRFKKTVKWMADWRERKDIEPWMLNNLATGLQHTADRPALDSVSDYVLEQPANDDFTQRFRLWRGIKEALRGEWDLAKHYLEHTDPSVDSQVNANLRGLLQELFRWKEPRQGKAVFTQQSKDALSAYRSGNQHRIGRETLSRTCQLIAKATGSFHLRWWHWTLSSWWKLATRIAMVLGVILVLVLYAWLKIFLSGKR